MNKYFIGWFIFTIVPLICTISISFTLLTKIEEGNIFVCIVEPHNDKFDRVWCFNDPQPKDALIGWFYAPKGRLEENTWYHVSIIQNYVISWEKQFWG